MREGKKEFISKYFNDKFHDFYGSIMFHAHDAQSGEIHNTFRHTRKIISCTNLNPLKINLEYDRTINFRDLIEIQELIRKNISALIDGFLFCFTLDEKFLTEEDVYFLEHLKAKFLLEIRDLNNTKESFSRKFN